MTETIVVLGVEQAKKNLQELSTKLQNNIVRASLYAAANVYLKATRAGTYGGGRTQRTGLLLRSQGVSTSKKGDVIGAKVRMKDRNIGGKSAFAAGVRKARRVAAPEDGYRGYKAFYWWFLEKGTGQRRTRGGANRGALSARPWVVPAFSSSSGSALDAFRETLKRRLEEAATALPKGVTR